MVAELAPVFIVSYLNRFQLVHHVAGSKAVVDVIRFFFVPVHVKSGVLLATLCLVKMAVIDTVNALCCQPTYHSRVVTFPVRFIPDGVAVKITNQHGSPLADNSIIIFNCLPNLGHILSVRVPGIVGPYCEGLNRDCLFLTAMGITI